MLPENAELWVFSDGVYEIAKEDGKVMTLDEFADHLKQSHETPASTPQAIHEHIKSVNADPVLEDDFSIMRVTL